MFLRALILVVSLAGFFLLVPGIVWLSTGSRRQAMEAARGYGWVVLILFVIPGAIGGVIAAFSLLLPS